jgi:hypothetical protein
MPPTKHDNRPSVFSTVFGGIRKVAAQLPKQWLINAQNILQDDMNRTVNGLKARKKPDFLPGGQDARVFSVINSWEKQRESDIKKAIEEYNIACLILEKPDVGTIMKSARYPPKEVAAHVMSMVRDPTNPHVIERLREVYRQKQKDKDLKNQWKMQYKLERQEKRQKKADDAAALAADAAASAADASASSTSGPYASANEGGKKRSRKYSKSSKSRKNRKTRSRK